ncbi:MAG: Rieske (2Fe-2S) protein [Gammaproteobacteria bacterium]|nr:Rieske (2Fe-2S) protein [Gammaproteobacteria bacterium]
MSFVPLARLAELHEGFRRVVRAGREEVLLLVHDGRPLLLQARCPHMGEPLLRAAVDGDRLRCPRHGFEFDLRSGRVLGERPCAPLQFLRPAWRGSEIGIELAG